MPKQFKVIKLKRNGPKPGQSTNAFLYGKAQEQKRFDDLLSSKRKQKRRKP